MKAYICFLVLCLFLILPAIGLQDTVIELKIMDYSMDSEMASLFMEENSNVKITIQNGDNGISDTQTLLQELITGGTDYDIFRINTSGFNFTELMEREFCVELDDAFIKESVKDMYPAIQNAISYNGKIYAVPCSAFVFTDIYHGNILEEMGLTESILPETFEDYCNLYLIWEKLSEDVQEEYTLLPTEDSKDWLLSTLMEQYLLYNNFEGKELRYDTTLFRESLNLLESVSSQFDEALKNAEYKRTLFTNSGSDPFVPGSIVNPIRLFKGAPVLVAGRLTAYIINPLSNHIDTAKAFVRFALENMTDLDKAAIYQTWDQPIPNDEAKAYMDDVLTPQKNALVEQLELADDAEKKSIQDNIDKIQYRIELEKLFLYNVSPDMLARYKACIGPNLVILKPGMYGADGTTGDTLDTVVRRYLHGEIDCEGFIQELDRKIMMFEMENI